MEWMIYAAATVAHAWVALGIWGVMGAYDDPLVRAKVATVTIKPMFFAPITGCVFFWFWFFAG